jgi:hypothetical protein
MKKLLIKLTSFILVCCTAFCLLSSCSKVGSFSVNEKIVCEVGGEPVTYDDYKYFFYSHLTQMQQIEPGTDFSSGEGYERVKALTEDSLKRRYVILSLCEKYGLEISDTDADAVNTYVENQIEAQGGKDKYVEYLLENRLTGDVFRAQTELTFCYDLYLRDHLKLGVDKSIDMTPEAIIADVTGGNFYRYTQIFFRLDVGELSTPLEADAKEAYALLCGGASFTSVAKDYSEWNKDHAQGVYATLGEKEEILENTVLDLEVGEFSEVVASTEGYHIFKRLPIDEEYVTENTELFEEQYFARRYLEFLEAKSKDVKVEYAKYFDSISFSELTRKETL